MRAAALISLAAVVLGAASLSAAATRPCSRALPRVRADVPAPITIATGCGSFRVGRDGRVRLVSSSPLPVPRGVAWWPGSGVWERLEHGHLLIGRWRTPLWRSHGRFPLAYAAGPIVLGP